MLSNTKYADDSEAFCNYYEVQCVNCNSITSKIDLLERNLSGHVPSEVREMKRLSVIVLNSRKLTQELSVHLIGMLL